MSKRKITDFFAKPVANVTISDSDPDSASLKETDNVTEIVRPNEVPIEEQKCHNTDKVFVEVPLVPSFSASDLSATPADGPTQPVVTSIRRNSSRRHFNASFWYSKYPFLEYS